MFPDSLWTNLLLFLLGQVAAIAYLRTGLVRRGVQLLVFTWLAVDVALVARFGYQDDGLVYTMSLVVMQVVSLAAAFSLVVGRIRRRSRRHLEQRARLMREAFVHYLRSEFEPAESLYAQVLRADPWDAAARLGLGTVLARTGKLRKSRRALRAARGLDADGRLRDGVESELARVSR